MNIANRPSSSAFTKFAIEPDDLVTVYGHPMRLVGQSGENVILQSITGNLKAKPRSYSWQLISKFLGMGKLEIEKGHFGVPAEIKRSQREACPGLEPETVLRARMVSEFLAQEYGEDNINEIAHRSRNDIERFMAVFKLENAALIQEARHSIEKKGKGKLFVSPRQFLRLVKKFEDGHLQPESLADRRAGRSGSGSTFTRDELTFQLRFADEYRTPDKKTIKQCWLDMHLANRTLIKQGQPSYRLPSLSTFRRLVKEGNDFLNEAGQSTNVERIKRKYDFKQRGLQPDRPLQIVEMDEHEFDLMVLCTKNGIWNYLHPEVRARIEKIRRAWICVALDAFTRSVCGMKILRGSPDASSAVATLAMVARTKDKIAASVGALTEWPQCGTPEAIHTDAGAGFVSAKFELACMMFTGTHRIPPSKHPHLRARVERFFKTLNQRYIHFFQGRTFSNPLLKDQYDSTKHATITDEELSDLLVRLIVDCYHNTKHRSLGMTPLEAWYRGSQLAKGAVAPPPSAREYREAFGATLTVKIGTAGIEILGNIYSSPKLLEIRKKWFDSTLIVRMSDEDISTISVKHKFLHKWIDVPAVFTGLKGTTLEEWGETVRYLKETFPGGHEHSQQTVMQAMAAVKEVIRKSKSRPGVILHTPLEEKIARYQETANSFHYNQRQEYDYGQYIGTVETSDDKLEEFFDDGFEAAVFNEDSENPLLGTDVSRMFEKADPFAPEDGSFDRSAFVSDAKRLLPPDQRADDENSTTRRSKRKTAPRAAKASTLRSDNPPPTPENEPVRSETEQTQPKSFGFERRPRREK
ncbi:transposase [Rhizobium sp. No.120]